MPIRSEEVDQFKAPCLHHEHNPPAHKVYPNGPQTHVCPKCAYVQHFIVNRPVWLEQLEAGES